MTRRDPVDEIYAEALRAAAREHLGTYRETVAECYPTVDEMIRERYRPASIARREQKESRA